MLKIVATSLAIGVGYYLWSRSRKIASSKQNEAASLTCKAPLGSAHVHKLKEVNRVERVAGRVHGGSASFWIAVEDGEPEEMATADLFVEDSEWVPEAHTVPAFSTASVHSSQCDVCTVCGAGGFSTRLRSWPVTRRFWSSSRCPATSASGS